MLYEVITVSEEEPRRRRGGAKGARILNQDNTGNNKIKILKRVQDDSIQISLRLLRELCGFNKKMQRGKGFTKGWEDSSKSP